MCFIYWWSEIEVNSKICSRPILNRNGLKRSWCLKPSRSTELLQRRYEVVQFFIDPNQQERMRNLRDHLKSVVNTPVSIETDQPLT